ncbi:TrkH family potassium uptake protein [Duncaniella muris]|jgi:trk system potassium uptake protein TrkH|uniref:TrkH family potassium uptake protein n=5 Tax=Duncaniella TaxID=2518495 RepID=A0A2V1IKI8_9BACT|nr:TrkH family potassium uptake protein [Duncaniella muris]NBH91774.1 TrkH family potassium uptake protein [Muribaculaceae bacterium S4]NBI20186.1 TrkH family potassium uptake protein [Muribaculaceae bacterium Z1]ROS88965.1 TrkH family potassium uptake protein [Muribaculaceae bacterium Isolate-039 (Harlan)]ROS98007.1 TrkH family potassium uptake protein [Muribaculaceae bacterium Isolate-083 (Janvier)]ROS99095.1 TrkH family potassium uptake protein [Muribaculaceae bacterium Isolate-077 (Janvier
MRFKDSASTINFRVLLRIIGLLLIIEGAFLSVPLVTSLIYQERDWINFLFTMGLTLTAGSLMTFCIRPRSQRMAKREGFLLTALVWVFFSIFGMIPFMLMEKDPLSVSDAFFEAMSGFTTTGATVISSISHLSHGVVIWRSLMQWIGGMGIILFTLAVVPMLNHSGGMQMFNAEVTGITHDKLRPRISQTAKGLWLIYIVLTAVLFVLLIIGPMNVFEALCHSFSTMSTGGFSTADDSIEAWDSVYIQIVMTIFMFLGGTSFVLLYRAAHGEFKPIWRNDVFRTYVGIIIGCYLLFVIAIIKNGQVHSVKSVTLDPLFQIISTITSTGYEISAFSSWGTFVLSLAFALMFFGSCAGSTSGGAKIDRLIYLLKNCRNEIVRSIHPNNILTVRVNDRVIPHETVSKVIAFLCLYVMIIMVGGILLTAMGLPLVDSFFSAFSCISNTGLGAGVTGYGGSYSVVPDLGKWLLALIMMIGRLELFTVLILFTPTFWKK